MMRFDSATCPNCQTYFDRLPVDGDEDGNYYIVLESTPCSTCGQMLCPCCEQFTCEHGEPHCIEHLAEVDGLKCCPVCLAEMAAADAGRPMCPDCGSVELVGEIFHGSMDRETGYTDCQELYRCLTCGSRGPTEDVIEPAAPTKREPQRETSPPIAASAGVA
jgi:hypothetical protein